MVSTGLSNAGPLHARLRHCQARVAVALAKPGVASAGWAQDSATGARGSLSAVFGKVAGQTDTRSKAACIAANGWGLVAVAFAPPAASHGHGGGGGWEDSKAGSEHLPMSSRTTSDPFQRSLSRDATDMSSNLC